MLQLDFLNLNQTPGLLETGQIVFPLSPAVNRRQVFFKSNKISVRGTCNYVQRGTIKLTELISAIEFLKRFLIA